jgi:hypothetical protein
MVVATPTKPTRPCHGDHRRAEKKCETWIQRLNAKFREEQRVKDTDSTDSSFDLKSERRNSLTSKLGKAKNFFYGRPKFCLRVTDYSELVAWARACVVEDRRHFEHLTAAVNAKIAFTERLWSWGDLERWYMEAGCMSRFQEFWVLRKSIGPRCSAWHETAVAEKAREMDALSREIIGVFVGGRAVNSSGRCIVFDEVFSLKVPVVDVCKRACLSR